MDCGDNAVVFYIIYIFIKIMLLYNTPFSGSCAPVIHVCVYTCVCEALGCSKRWTVVTIQECSYIYIH